MKKAHIILAALLLSMSLTGCGNESEKTSSTADNSVEAQSETENSTELEVIKPETEAETDGAAAAEPKEVFALNGPMGRYQGSEEFDSASFAASFDKEALVKTDDGAFSLNVMIYCYELFSGEDINALNSGDIIWCLGEQVVIDTVETSESGAVIINGGIEAGGRVLKTDDNSVYFEAGMNDIKSYYEIGENTYALAEDFVFTDNSNPEQSVTYTAEEFFALAPDEIGFTNANTIVDTTDGVITAIERRYIP